MLVITPCAAITRGRCALFSPGTSDTRRRLVECFQIVIPANVGIQDWTAADVRRVPRSATEGTCRPLTIVSSF